MAASRLLAAAGGGALAAAGVAALPAAAAAVVAAGLAGADVAGADVGAAAGGAWVGVAASGGLQPTRATTATTVNTSFNMHIPPQAVFYTCAPSPNAPRRRAITSAVTLIMTSTMASAETIWKRPA